MVDVVRLVDDLDLTMAAASTVAAMLAMAVMPTGSVLAVTIVPVGLMPAVALAPMALVLAALVVAPLALAAGYEHPPAEVVVLAPAD
jgi:hypothetical protein